MDGISLSQMIQSNQLFITAQKKIYLWQKETQRDVLRVISSNQQEPLLSSEIQFKTLYELMAIIP